MFRGLSTQDGWNELHPDRMAVSSQIRTDTKSFGDPCATITLYSLELKLAEGEGFEPPVSYPTTVFKTAALNHSATLPNELFQTILQAPIRWNTQIINS